MTVTDEELRPFSIPGTLDFEREANGLWFGTVSTALCRARFYLHGGHVTHFQPAHSEYPVLFLSREAVFQEGKPIRGGIPICFPWFGSHPQSSSEPAHGQARLRPWKVLKTDCDGESVRVSLGLELAPYSLQYDLVFGSTLDALLTTTNFGTTPETFEIALHTYLQTGSIEGVSVRGLERLPFFDQLTSAQHAATGVPIRFTEETDRIYTGETEKIVVEDKAWNRSIQVVACGSKSTVVWNPWIAKSQRMPDFGDLEYLQMCCVETANIRNSAVVLAPHSTHQTALQLSVSTGI